MKTLDIMPISLTQGLYALVDGEDYEELSKYKWYAKKDKKTYYAGRTVYLGGGRKNPKNRIIFMHRQILNVPGGRQTDHQNHCGLDNRKQNIKVCTQNENQHNQIVRKRGTSKFKGVHWVKGRIYNDKQYKSRWRAKIVHNGKSIYLGYFDNEIEAAKAYDDKAKELFGNFAGCNFK